MAVPLKVTTPLGGDVLALTAFTGQEEISKLFQFELDMFAGNDAQVPFESLLGAPVTVSLTLPDGSRRPFNGIVSRFSQGTRGKTHTMYSAEVVPQLWLLQHRRTSRIFQQVSVPDILSEVLGAIDTSFHLQGAFEPRDYCVQYRESDFDFASRLMEEEGIFYFFEHGSGGHTMVVGNTPDAHLDVPAPVAIPFQGPGNTGGKPGIQRWEKAQELTAGRVTLRDHQFELPHQSLEAPASIQDTVQAGQVTHHLHVAGNDQLELYDYPGGYAKRFDGIDPGGQDDPEELAKIQPDATRTAGIRMGEEAAAGLVVDGTSTARNLAAGHGFTLRRHFNGDGPYVLTGVNHSASLSGNSALEYRNTFSCIPIGLPYRPPRLTPRPVIPGSQTAVVVGPAGEEIYTDKYGRIKVQFHWDRQGQNDANSSCWIRVGALHAGQEGGFGVAPEIGDEVVVAFEEGDPDRPLITGSVYNPDRLPPPRPVP